MDLIIKILQFFLCFTILVGIHELGHFFMARVFHIRVEKFYIFFDPWFSLFKFRHKGTEYGLGWLPLGGYVKIAGMIDESMDKEQMKQPAKPDEFRAKPAWQRFLVMIAGVVMNVLLAIVIYCGICYTWGDTYLANEDARWGYDFNEAGHELGFRDGDRILAIDNQPVEKIQDIVTALLITEGDRHVRILRDSTETEIVLPLDALIAMRQEKGYEGFLKLRYPFIVDSTASAAAKALLRPGDEICAVDELRNAEFPEYRKYIASKAGDSVRLDVLRDGARIALSLPVSDEGVIGVTARNGIYTPRTQKYTPWESIPAGIHRTGEMLASYWEQLKLIVQPKTKMYEELGGFIAIGSIFPSEWDWQDFWIKTAFLSIILAVMNILPIPGLDGGHAIFTFWEMISGRKVSEKVLETAQYVGMFILLMLLLYANGNDIYRFFIK